MDKMTRSKSLLVEMLLAALFLAISATVILRLFLLAHTTARQAALVNRATAEAQNWEERLRAADDAESFLTESGFLPGSGSFTLKTDDGLYIEILVRNTETDWGLLIHTEISVDSGGEQLAEIEGCRYVPGEAE